MSKVTTKKSNKGNRTLQSRTKVSQGAFLKEYLKTRNISKSCEKAGIDRKTYYDWMKTEFKERFDDTVQALDDVIEEGLQYYVSKRNPDILKFMAKNRNPLRSRGYSEKTEVELSGEVNNKVELKLSLPDDFEE